MERKKKINKGRMKVSKNKSFEKELKFQKPTKITNFSLPHKEEHSMKLFSRISYHNYGYIPVNIFEVKKLEKKEESKGKQEKDYSQKVSEIKEKMDKAKSQVNELVSKEKKILELFKEIEEKINYEKNKIVSKINKIKNEEIIIESLKNETKMLEDEVKKSEMKKNVQKQLNKTPPKPSKEIILFYQEIDKEKNNLSNMKAKKDKNEEDISIEEQNIQIKSQAINDEQNKKMELIQKKNELKEQYEKANKIAINDNKFCHDNFYSLLTFFPYLKNVAFISNHNDDEEKADGIENLTEIDINKIITDEEINEDIEKENINNIKLLIDQRENSDKNINFKILKDRRTLQINPKEKYKFKKIFSTINNNYNAEPWNKTKISELKLSTINSYFNEFNMTSISNNYFIIYFIPKIEKTSTSDEIFKLFEKLKNNEYIDKNLIIKISAITESNYINLQNIEQKNAIKNQLFSINNAGIYTIYGFLFEFIKTNRLNKKNIFRIYNFDYYYPYAVEMMNSINKYYAKKKRKKTGVYKKVIRQGPAKQKKKQEDRSISNNNLNKGKNKPNVNNNKNNLKKVQFKKTINNLKVGNTKRNNSFISSAQRNKLNNKNKNNLSKKLNKTSKENNNKNISNDKNLITSQQKDEKNILKKSGSQNKSSKQGINKINLNVCNNIKTVNFDTQTKSVTPKKNNSEKKSCVNRQKTISLVFNDLKIIKPEHTLIIHDIDAAFVNSNEFKSIAKACGILNNNDK
jgi:hypothetical protein